MADGQERLLSDDQLTELRELYRLSIPALGHERVETMLRESALVMLTSAAQAEARQLVERVIRTESGKDL
jgi:hypothetical protein